MMNEEKMVRGVVRKIKSIVIPKHLSIKVIINLKGYSPPQCLVACEPP
ncbi:hypothetical protein [Flammeovirga aprica]|uniref:Uncharacterized protein n=1 Tax=Flammeovirga aprica JL-4 TaxID=694437 RepID=A0A7X9RZA9_9BACT|nr:hypothetical protein [Flammeovirga aprica]NME71523.1 hypothetical protein [Flammeovirga aprica JL-4]